MEWYRSEMKSDGKKQKIVHHFYCSKCGRIETTEHPHRIALRLI